MLRAKFTVTSVCRNYQFAGETVTMNPVYSADPESENHAFWQASPNGELKMTISNPDAVGKLELGKEYYIDFAEAK